MDALAIVKRIEIRLAEIGMSKASFYDKSGVTSASYSHWNTGKFNPTPKKLKSAAECLGLSYDYLVTGSEQNEKAPTREGECSVSEDDLKAAFYSGYSDDLSDEAIDELWADAKEYARFKAEQFKRKTK